MDADFHRITFRFADNPFLMQVYYFLAVQVWAMRRYLTFAEANVRRSFDYHQGQAVPARP